MNRPAVRLAAHPGSRCNPAPRSPPSSGAGRPGTAAAARLPEERPGGQGTRRHHYPRGRLHHRARRPWPRTRGRRRAPAPLGIRQALELRPARAPAGEDKAWLEETMRASGAVIADRGTYASPEAANERSPTASARTWNSPTRSDPQAVPSTSGTPPNHVITTQGYRRPAAAPDWPRHRDPARRLGHPLMLLRQGRSDRPNPNRREPHRQFRADRPEGRCRTASTRLATGCISSWLHAK